MTDRKRAYVKFLQSCFWREMTAAKKAMIGRCERCGSDRHLQSHHRFYRQDWYATQLEDLEVLCRGCHRAEHGKSNRTWLWSQNEEIEMFFWACSEYIKGVVALSVGKQPQEDISLEFLQDVAADYPEYRPIQYHLRKAVEWKLMLDQGLLSDPLPPTDRKPGTTRRLH